MKRVTGFMLPLLGLALCAQAQDDPRPPRVDEVLVPERAFDDVFERFPKGAIMTRDELNALVNKAAGRPAPPPPPLPSPVPGTLEHLSVKGQIGADQIATIQVTARVRLLKDEGRIPLPLIGQGVTEILLDGEPARVWTQGQHLVVLATEAGEHTLSWSQIVKVQPGEERGSGVLRLQLPQAASGRLDVSAAGDLELNRVDGGVGWTEAGDEGQTHLACAFGDLQQPLTLAFRPRRAISPVTPFTTGDVFTLFEVKNDVVTLSSTLVLNVYRAPRDVIHVDLPAGFVLRALKAESPGLGELTPIQDEQRVRIKLNGPRQGNLFFRLVAERPLQAGEALNLGALTLPDTDRVAGMLAVARGGDTRIRFEGERDLERADLATLPRQPAGILRAYRHGEAPGNLNLDVRPLEPRVDLSMRVAFKLEARSVRAVAAFKYRVREGRVFTLNADLPPGFVVEDVNVSLVGTDQAPDHQLDRTYTTSSEGEQTHLRIKLAQGLEAGQQLVLIFEAQREEDSPLAGRTLEIPRLGGSPASSSGGYLGFAPDAAYRLQGEDLSKLVGVPAAELPKLGLQVPGLMLGYQIEGEGYGGTLQLTRRETRLAADLRVRHQVRERVVRTDVRANLNVQGAPLETLDVLVPAGLGASARYEHPDLHEDRERIQTADVPAGWERYRLRFVRRQQGEISVLIRLQSKLPASEEGKDAVEVGALPSVRLVEAFRQRGQIAIYSADATELEAIGSGVRELEVAEVESEGGYPLFAYAFVNEHHAVGLTVRRHEAAPMLTAVAESLLLQTTSGADGHSRHTATFTVKNLGNQFFALRLPDGANLWSVVVDGEGVKPAQRDGLMIIPITVAGDKSASDAVEVAATYSVDREAWASMDDLRLVAPELCLGSEDVVPVLRTEWQLTLPDDYQVLEVSGNVHQDAGAARQTPLLVSTLRQLAHGGEWVFGLAILGLLIAASASARHLLLAALVGADATRRTATRGAAGVLTNKAVWIAATALAGLGLLYWLFTSVGGADAMMPKTAAVQYETSADYASADAGAAYGGEGSESYERDEVFRGGDKELDRYNYDAPSESPAADEPFSGAKKRSAPMSPPPPPSVSAPSPAKPSARPRAPKRDVARKELELAKSEAQAPRRQRAAEEKAKDFAPPAEPAPMDSMDEDMDDMAEGEPTPEDAGGMSFADEEESSGADGDGWAEKSRSTRESGGRRGNRGPGGAVGQAQAGKQLGDANGDPANSPVVLESEVELTVELSGLVERYGETLNKGGAGGGGGFANNAAGEDAVASLSLDASRIDGLVEQNQSDPTLRLLRAKVREAQGDLEGALQDAERAIQLRGGSESYKAKGQILAALGRDDEAKAAFGLQRAKERASIPQGDRGQVGLSSLVLGWTPVGRRYAFSRDGGGAQLGVEVTRTGAMITAFGMLALIGCALGLLLPLLTRVHVLAVLVVGVGVLSALPLLILPVKFVPICNALALGLACAGPIHLAWAMAKAWDTGPLSRLGKAMRAERQRRRGVGSGGAAALVALCALGGMSSAQADDKQAAERPFRVYVPYDADNDGFESDRVYVPNDVYAELFRRAFPEQTPAVMTAPPRNALITRADYTGQIDARGKLDLSCTLRVDVLANGWQTVSLGLLGTGLEAHTVSGGKPDARVMSAPAGGYQLIARGPAVYEIELSLIAPSAGGRYAFSTAPCAASRMKLTSAVANRRIVIGGADAQRDLNPDGTQVEASIAGQRVAVALVAREVLSAGGASEASANTRSVVYVQRGRVLLRSVTDFAVSGAGREGFTFELPAGFEVTEVKTQLMRSWSVTDGVLRVDLRRPSPAKHQVLVQGELKLSEANFAAPHVTPQGITRERGELALVVEDGLRVLPKETSGLRRAGPAGLRPLLANLAGPRESLEIARAYSFVRRPCSLQLERVEEELEIRARNRVAVRVDADGVNLTADLHYEVRRGKAYELNVLVPTGFALVNRSTALDLREVGLTDTKIGRIYRLGLGSGLKGSGDVRLTFARRHSLEQGKAELGFCDVRTLGVSQETSEVALAVANGLRLRVNKTPEGLTPHDVRSVTRGWSSPTEASWVVGYRRGESAADGLAQATIRVHRPEPKISGSWVLHAQVERDVVRYDLRALYEIDEAGARRFVLEIPAAVGARYQVEGLNLREVRRTAGAGDRQQIEVTLQSAVESFYTLSCTWEENINPGKPFSLSEVGLRDVNRTSRGFVLVEKGAGVPERLEEVSRSGAIDAQRAADAPALPPGRGPRDFALSYRVETERAAPWSVEWKLTSTGQQRQPAPARVLWSRLVSVFDGEGLVRHRVTYRVRNLRLQFLTLQLPSTETGQGTRSADVWSVFVDGQPKRLHHRGDLLLIPLPKRTDADLSFDVEVTYATPLPKRFKVGQVIRPQPPVLKTDRVAVERNFWTLYVPERYTYGNFGGTLQQASGEAIPLQTISAKIDVNRQLQKIATKGEGQNKVRALDNLVLAQEEVRKELQQMKSQRGSLRQEEALQLQELEKSYRGVEQSRDKLQRELEAEAQQTDPEELQQYEQTSYGWNRNVQVQKRDTTKWTGVGKKANQAEQLNEASGEDDLVLKLNDGTLNLKNAEVVARQLKDGKLEDRRVKSTSASTRAPRGDWGESGPQGQQGFTNNQDAKDGYLGLTSGDLDHRGAVSEAGLLSLAVTFDTPGTALYFEGTGDQAVQLELSVYPETGSSWLTHLAQALALLVLLGGAFRFGLFTRTSKPALQALALLAVGGLVGAIFVHLGGAALALVAGLAGLRFGPPSAA